MDCISIYYIKPNDFDLRYKTLYLQSNKWGRLVLTASRIEK